MATWAQGESSSTGNVDDGCRIGTAQFIALSLPPLPSPSAPAPAPAVAAVDAEEIRLEFKRGAIGVSVTWPVSAAADCAVWLR